MQSQQDLWFGTFEENPEEAVYSSLYPFTQGMYVCIMYILC